MSAIAPVPMRRVGVDESLGEPGSFAFASGNGEARYLNFACARPDCLHSVPVRGHPRAWTWDGNEDTPTLSPSIRDIDGCRWHGFITAGQLITCGDAYQGTR